MINGKYCILVVDDDTRMCKAINDFLSINGYITLLASNGVQALDAYYANNQNIDLILLDVMMPKMNGFEMLKQLREHSLVPVIMLTAKAEESDQLHGLKKGADDYIIKPFSPSLLLARIESILRRCHQKEQEIFYFGNVSIMPESRLIKINEQEVTFTQKEYDLLLHFCNHRSQILNRDQILNAVWGFDYTGDVRTIDTHVKQLRYKLRDTTMKINTVHGIGYRFEVENEKICEI